MKNLNQYITEKLKLGGNNKISNTKKYKEILDEYNIDFSMTNKVNLSIMLKQYIDTQNLRFEIFDKIGYEHNLYYLAISHYCQQHSNIENLINDLEEQYENDSNFIKLIKEYTLNDKDNTILKIYNHIELGYIFIFTNKYYTDYAIEVEK